MSWPGGGSNPARSAPEGIGAARAEGEEASWVEAAAGQLHLAALAPWVWNRFGPMFAGEIRRKRGSQMRQFTHWRWHLDEVYVRINGEMRYLWRAVDHVETSDFGLTAPLRALTTGS